VLKTLQCICRPAAHIETGKWTVESEDGQTVIGQAAKIVRLVRIPLPIYDHLDAIVTSLSR
jgi:hypothetical protein